jgi:hypothetical protein
MQARTDIEIKVNHFGQPFLLTSGDIASWTEFGERITAATQKAGFRVPKTVLWLMKVRFLKSSFVVKDPPFG